MLKSVVRASLGRLGYAVVRKATPAALRAELEQARYELARAAGERAELDRQLAGTRAALQTTEGQLEGYKNALHQTERHLEGYQNALGKAERDAVGLKNANDRFEQMLGASRQPGAAGAAGWDRKLHEAAHAELRAELAAARREIDRLKSGTRVEPPAAVLPVPADIEVVKTDPGDTAPTPVTAPVGGFYTPIFDFDGLRSDPAVIHNHDFLADPRFARAYARGIRAHGEDERYYWRMYVGLWCAAHAAHLPGDFVECGVWRGFLSSAVMDYLDWNSFGKTFYLFDTFQGIDEGQVTAEERSRLCLEHHRERYADNWSAVKANFAEYRNVVLVKGSVPASLGAVGIGPVAYLSIDMNNVTPELAAADYFWDRLVPGGLLLLDDYGFVSYEEQKKGFDQFAAGKGVKVLALPTGQGLIVKPT